MARRPYSTAARLHKDSAQVVTLKWYPVAEPVQCLPFQCKVNSLDWSSHPWLASGVGEVWGEPRPYNGATALPYAVGMTPCEPAAVFREGEVLDPDRPDQVYNLDGFPACCLNVWTPAGGVEWDGNAFIPSAWNTGLSCLTAPTQAIQIGAVHRVSNAAGAFWWTQTIGTAFQFRVRLVQKIGGNANTGVFGFSGTCSTLNAEFSLFQPGDLSPVMGPGAASLIYMGGGGQSFDPAQTAWFQIEAP